jgi:hypothetical protein
MVVFFSLCIEHLDESNLSGRSGRKSVATDSSLPILGVFHAQTVIPGGLLMMNTYHHRNK